MRAEREKRAVILHVRRHARRRDQQRRRREAAGDQGVGGEEAQQINEAEGAAAAILAIAGATAEGLRKVAEQIQIPGGTEAVQPAGGGAVHRPIRELAKAGNTFVIPANIADLTSMFALATNILGSWSGAAGGRPPGRQRFRRCARRRRPRPMR